MWFVYIAVVFEVINQLQNEKFTENLQESKQFIQQIVNL